MSLRFKSRIALYNTVGTAILIACIFILIYGVVYSTSNGQADAGIRQEYGEALGNILWQHDSIIVNKMPEWQEGEHAQIEANPTFLQITDITGHTVFSTANLLNKDLPTNTSIESEYFFHGVLGDRHLRIGVFPIHAEHFKKIGTVTIGISEDGSILVLKNLRIALISSFFILLVALYFTTSFAASKSIEPVNQLIKSAAGIDDSSIDKRLPLPLHKDEVFMLATTINDLLSRIEVSILRQKQFTADASHEMRTPLAAIRGTLEVLINKLHDPVHTEKRIREVIRQVDRITQLIAQLLQLARLESGDCVINNEYVMLHPFIHYLKEQWEPQLYNRSIDLQMKIPVEAKVSADSFFLEFILDNLVGNSIKYGNDEGVIVFDWNEERNCLSISDDGPGIASQHLPHLFDRFYRADESRSLAIEGNGLGLAIVKKMADLQRIQISVSSKEGKGARFDLIFPESIPEKI